MISKVQSEPLGRRKRLMARDQSLLFLVSK